MSQQKGSNKLPPTLSVRNLEIEYKAKRGAIQAGRDISFDLQRGEAIALIGESGSGKTTAALGFVRLLPENATIKSGAIIYRRWENGQVTEIDVLSLNARQLRDFRWRDGAMVFQAALNAFNPVLRISAQFADTARAHGYITGRKLKERAMHLFDLVRLDPERVWHSYPHELSGGMRQRVLIALSLLLEPQLLILDEPTTALDILTQRNIIDTLKELRQKLDFSLIFISHDLSLAVELADRIGTMYAGRIVELCDVETTFRSPHHPYTIGLMKAVPTLSAHKDSIASIPGSPPDFIDMPQGCKFHPRCPLADEKCRTEEPGMGLPTPDHEVACWKWETARDSLAGGWK